MKRYSDGIFGSDPVSLAVRNGQGATLAETPMARDVHVACWKARQCVVFRYDGSVLIGPTDMWRLQDEGLVHTTSLWLRLVGIFLPLRADWPWYLLATALFYLPITGVRRTWKEQASFLRALCIVALAVLGSLFLLFWLYVVVVLSALDVSLLVVVMAGVALLSLKIGRINLTGRRREALGHTIQGAAQQ